MNNAPHTPGRSSDNDPTMSALLELTNDTPSHRHAFWADLDDRLGDVETETGGRASATPAHFEQLAQTPFPSRWATRRTHEKPTSFGDRG